MKLKDLYKKFIEHRELDNFKMKLGLLLIVEGVLCGADKGRLVNCDHVKLLGNMEKFWKFPWGRVAYMELHRSLNETLEHRMSTIDGCLNQDRVPYVLQGMPVVFQV